MRTESFLIVGAGGHAKVVIDAMRCLDGVDCLLQLADDDVKFTGLLLMGLPIVVPVDKALQPGGYFHVAIGNNRFRSRVADFCLQAGMKYHSVLHSRAMVAASAEVGIGCFVAAGAILAPESSLGVGCIVNHGAVIDHDCRLGAFCHVAPNATLGGGVAVGDGVLIGAGANVLPGVSIGEGCVVGAGAVVLHNLPAGGTYVGVPAQCLQG
ncbi:MAG: acetyltransferase [Gammaproteobacteria bacterium]|nr:acetyltransferase [Gammaproteobacteria bacterium]